MNLSSILSLSLTPAQKRAVFKLAVELVKADNRIHRQEVFVLTRLQEALALEQEQLDLIHYCTMQDAIEVLRGLREREGGCPARDAAVAGRQPNLEHRNASGNTARDTGGKAAGNATTDAKEILCRLFTEIMCSDNDIDFDESILLSSVTMSIRSGSQEWCSVLSIPLADTRSSERQIIFLEKKRCGAAHAVLDDAYDNLLITKAFGDIGLNLLYLPEILRKLKSQLGGHEEHGAGESGEGKFELLKRSMGFIVPAGNKIKLNNLDAVLASLDTPTFLRVILSRYNLSSDTVPYDAFLLLKISDSQVLNDSNALENYTNFLCIDLSRDVKKRIFEFISRFDEQDHLISYEGYYKFIYGYLSSESKSVKPIRLDPAYQFYAGDETLEQIVFKSSPQARTFYLLLLFYGPYGIRQSLFNESVEIFEVTDVGQYVQDGLFDYLEFKNQLIKRGGEASRLIINTMEIYRVVSTKDDESPEFINYAENILKHRSSLKNYINKGFETCDILANRDRFLVSYDGNSRSYSVSAVLSDFRIGIGSGTTPLQDSSLWKKLK